MYDILCLVWQYVIVMLVTFFQTGLSYDKMFIGEVLYGVYGLYIQYISTRSVISDQFEDTQTNVNVICNYIEVFNMGACGIDFIHSFVYK